LPVGDDRKATAILVSTRFPMEKGAHPLSDGPIGAAFSEVSESGAAKAPAIAELGVQTPRNTPVASPEPLTALIRKSRPRIGLPAMLMVLLTYAFMAIVCFTNSAHAHGDHSAFETLRLPDEAAVMDGSLTQHHVHSFSTLTQAQPRLALAGWSSALAPFLSPNATPPQAAIILATWLHLALNAIAQPPREAALWDDVQLPGLILARWHRSVVLHL
jgi:hypothetical protein